MNDRGEYRGIFVSFADDPDAHALSGDAVKLLLMLKLTLPPTGIGIVYLSKLCDQVNCERARLDQVFAELEAPKPGRDRGWIVRERNVVWIVNALAFETNLNPANQKKHVPFVRKLIAQLDSRLEIVSAFKKTYPQWFQGDPITSAKPSNTVSDSLSKPKHLHTTPLHSNPNSGDLEQERARSDGLSHAAAPLTDALAQLPKPALDFLRTFYPRNTANAERRTDVAQQLCATLNGGAEYRGQRVQAFTVDRLATKCRDVMREGVRDPDKAIAVLLLKLGDTSDQSAPGVTVAKIDAAQSLADERETNADLERASAWLSDHPDVDASIDEQLERDGFERDLDETDVRRITRNIARNSLILAAWRNAGASEPSHV